jgi:hypothetical protein
MIIKKIYEINLKDKTQNLLELFLGQFLVLSKLGIVKFLYHIIIIKKT